MSNLDPMKRSSASVAMLPDWHLLRSVRGGTRTMREAGELYLPKHESESDAHYKARLAQTFLKNMLQEALDNIVGKTFAKPVGLSGEYDKAFDEWAENIDLQGHDLHTFAKGTFEEGTQQGFSGIAVDVPKVPKGEDGTRPEITLAQQRELGLRPYMRAVKAEDILGGYVSYETGVPVLKHIRLYEREIDINEATFEEVIVERVREWTPSTWRLHQRIDKGEWSVVDQGPNPIGRVPVVLFIAGRKVADFVVEPLFRDLAYKCVEYWQSNSDQRNALKYGRFPIAYATGVTVDPSQPLVFGPGRLLTAPEQGSRFGYLETGGNALKHGFDDLQMIREEGERMGLKPFMPRTGTQVATARALDEATANSVAQALAMHLVDCLEEAFRMMAAFASKTDEQAPEASVSTDFGVSLSADTEIKNLIELRKLKEISHEALMDELMRRSLLRPGFNTEDDQALIDAEDPVGGLGGADDGAGDDLPDPANDDPARGGRAAGQAA